VNDALWVTGLGLVTPLGPSVEATWARVVRGERALRPIRLFDASAQRASIAGEVDGVTLPGGPPEVVAGWSRTSAMALSAALEAMRMAGLAAPASQPSRPRVGRTGRVGLVIGGTTGGMFETELMLAQVRGEPEAREATLKMLAHPLTATGERLDEILGPFARVRTLSSACSSGSNALVVAAGWLLAGEVDAVVAGGSDGLCRLTLSGFNAIAALDPEACRPFDRKRRGTNLGEGAGFLVLERAETARSRGAAPVAELAGWAIGSEAHHITHPAPDGAVVAALIERALDRARLRPADVDYVNAHGTGTLANDETEAAALVRAFGDDVRRVPVSSSKGQIGHTLGAAGAIEAVITALVVARRTLVPTAGLTEPDPALGILHVPDAGREVPRVRAALSNAFGFGGMDTVLVFAQPDLRREDRGARNAPARTAPAVPAASSLVITGAAIFGPGGRHASAACAELPAGRFDGHLPVDPDAFLDADRARRLDLVARLGAVAVEHALEDAGAPRAGTGLLLGRAFGSVDGCAAFLRRVVERGPRAASPAEFPNLVPSAPIGHVSIYGELRGPTFGTSDLYASGESAVIQACQLIAAGEAARMLAGAAEPRGAIGPRVLGPLFHEPGREHAVRSDLAAAVLIESEEGARGRGARVLARIEAHFEWRGDPATALARLRGPRAKGAEVVLARATDATDRVLAGSAWSGCARVVCAPALGESDALGAAAVAVAAGRVGTAAAPEVLVVGAGERQGYAILLVGP
jgi:3-oxoacyl-[acyl-carrier-protein] synthase II